MKNLLLFCCLVLAFAACKESKFDSRGIQTSEPHGNPAAEGFDLSSDVKAIALADATMQAMGGRKNWDNTRYIQWTFFGMRTHTWDKHKGIDRIEIPKQNMVYIVNVKDTTGLVFENGVQVTDEAKAKQLLGSARAMWVNDSYWLVMPFKLKDSGVHLKYLGEDTTQYNEPADMIEMTFKNVGYTPQNKYHIAIDKETRLMSEWTFFAEDTATVPKFVMPWKNYQTYGNIKLSDDRGNSHITDVAVLEEVNEALWNTAEVPATEEDKLEAE